VRIALIDSFFDTSHKLWAQGLQQRSTHSIDIYAGSPHHWKWKMTGGTMSLAKDLIASCKYYDLLIVTDMVHLPLFRSMLTADLLEVPILLYFHENQITYPWSLVDQKEDRHFGWINYVSACQADLCVFNSKYHKKSFLEALPRFLKPFPKFDWKADYNSIVDKSRVLSIGLDLPAYTNSQCNDLPIFIWNHRWEYDKNPELFFNTLISLSTQDVNFKLIVVGKSYKRSPPIFEEAKVKLEKHIIHWGWAETKEDYNELLKQANMLLVSNEQDFFGISIIEAMASGCYPVLPYRLAYPEHVLQKNHKHVFYKEDSDEYIQKYDWHQMIGEYDLILEQATLSL